MTKQDDSLDLIELAVKMGLENGLNPKHMVGAINHQLELYANAMAYLNNTPRKGLYKMSIAYVDATGLVVDETQLPKHRSITASVLFIDADYVGFTSPDWKNGNQVFAVKYTDLPDEIFAAIISGQKRLTVDAIVEAETPEQLHLMMWENRSEEID